MNAFPPLVLANGWNHVEHMMYFLLVFGGCGTLLTVIFALRPTTRRWALISGIVVLIVCAAVVVDIVSRL